MDYNLDNKKVLITGASGGIGTSLCEKFISTNCKIICTATSNEKIKILKNNYGSDHYYYLLNLSSTMNHLL